jgi:hypothetical protein
VTSAPGLTQDDNELVGFVTTSLVCGAIDSNEFREWCDLVIANNDVESLPQYVIELSMSKGSLMPGIYNVIGFVPHWDHSDGEADALQGIAVKRKKVEGEWSSISNDEALKALRENPEIEDRFRKTFPFIRM